MGDQENCMRMIKSACSNSKKRPIGATVPDQSPPPGQLPATTKRVVLGDLTNSLNIKNPNLFSTTQKPKCKPKLEKKAEEEALKPQFDVIKASPQDPQKFSDAPLIYQYLQLLEVEEKRRPLPDYMEKVQKDITPGMREILIDWLVEVADEYKLVSDTLYLAVNYIDRYLSSHALSRTKLQLLGVASMLVSSKFEEISPPHVEDFCYMTDNTYTREEVVTMEVDVLKFLNYEMSNPTTKTFLRIFTKAAQANSTFSNLQFEFLAGYIAELSLLDYTCVRFLPSMIAASAVFLARITLQPNIPPWSLALQHYTGFKPSELKECILAIHDLQICRRCTSNRAVREKYMEHKFKCVSALCPSSEIPQHYFDVVDGKH